MRASHVSRVRSKPGAKGEFDRGRARSANVNALGVSRKSALNASSCRCDRERPIGDAAVRLLLLCLARWEL